MTQPPQVARNHPPVHRPVRKDGTTEYWRGHILAESESSGAELDELYETGAIWRNIVQNLGAARVDEEVQTREVLDSFQIDAAPDMDDFSLYTVRPDLHARSLPRLRTASISPPNQICQTSFRSYTKA